jgi:predicted lipoprotein with Yx(FWY)xxD motif
MSRRPIAARVAASLCAVLLFAACSTGSSSGASPTPAAGNATITVASSAAGDHLAGPNGHSLYLFAPDTANTSTCTDSCAQNWPPLTVAAGQTPAAGSGLALQLTTITRADGSLQVTANGLPLYYFGGDSAAADINGQGKNGVWFLAGADGKALSGGAPASGASPSPSSAASPSNNGYPYY